MPTKTLPQIILDRQASECHTTEELFVLWQLMHQIEPDPIQSATTYPEIDPRSFHLDGIVSPDHFTGILYILKEPSLKKQIQLGSTVPIIADTRRRWEAGPISKDDELNYITAIQNHLIPYITSQKPEKSPLKTAAVLYLNKRGGKEVTDNTYLNYADQYSECIKREIHLISPKLIICGGEDIFRWILKEVFSNKKAIKNKGDHMIWKNMVQDYHFTADKRYRHTSDPKKKAITVLNMWSPSYRINKDMYVSPKEYLKEFEKRTSGLFSEPSDVKNC